MVNVQLRSLEDVDGTPVLNVAFDLSTEQLGAAAHACGEILVERHRGEALSTDDVLALRELTGVRDELDRLHAAAGHGTVLLPLARYIALHDAVDEWLGSRREREWLRDADADAMPLLAALLPPMEQLRGDAVEQALAAAEVGTHD